ncbi:DUF2309 domain-containing protein [Gelidibacter salicanalis]|nr:DUF2309 domain-containing protein [Gelidibacter salicanalis]
MKDLQTSIREASNTFGTTWPLYSFVTSNPLSGQENFPFEKAVEDASKLLNAKTYPSADMYQQALEKQDIDIQLLENILKANGLTESSRAYLNQMRSSEAAVNTAPYEELDVMMAKWLSVFMDEGLAEWQMPNKEKGFYKAWKALASHDGTIKKSVAKQLPNNSLEALKNVLDANVITDYKTLFLQHMAPLSGWMGYIKHRLDTNSLWQQQYPINFGDYLAVRLTLAQVLYGNVEIASTPPLEIPDLKLKHLWLEAWEQTFQKNLFATLKTNSITTKKNKAQGAGLDAQMVFCIDTRSEAIRRHIENKGAYETFGYAGFFGIAMDYQHYEANITTKSCPPIVGSPYLMTEQPNTKESSKKDIFINQKQFSNSKEFILKRLKNMLPSSFGFVEGAGFFYGISLLFKTIAPQSFYRLGTRNKIDHEGFCEPKITYNHSDSNAGKDISLDEKVAIVKGGFDLIGWRNFAPLVLFVGHGSHTTNNPFASSLDCGACAASPGRHNARLLAQLANTPEVRDVLKTKHDIIIPVNTVFIGGEHNTTTDTIVLFDNNVPVSHEKALHALKVNLKKAQQTATEERLLQTINSVKLAHKKATDWDDTRPEWGLAKNAGFIVGSRSLTYHSNLNGRCFLHSYDYKLDSEGAALEGIMCGPMVVTQWINNHYYFTTVDTDKFGGGSKITHNITGKFGVVQGNGGDLKMGLPLQSLKATDTEMYHQPLRLTVVIQAPLRTVEAILKKHAHLKSLLDNGWIYMTIINPDADNQLLNYKKDFNWHPEEKAPLQQIKMFKTPADLEVTV